MIGRLVPPDEIIITRRRTLTSDKNKYSRTQLPKSFSANTKPLGITTNS